MKLLFLLPLLFLFACDNGGSGSGSSKKDTPKGPNEAQDQGKGETPVNLPDHTAYYNQFLFQTEDVGDDPDFPETIFRYLMVGLPRDFQAENGKKRTVTLEIGLFDDGTFKSKYSENEYINDINFIPAGCKEVQGSWDVIGDKIELVSNGVIYFIGERFFKDEKHMILFKINEKIISKLPSNVEKIDLSLGYTNIGYPEESLFKCSPFGW